MIGLKEHISRILYRGGRSFGLRTKQTCVNRLLYEVDEEMFGQNDEKWHFRVSLGACNQP